MISYDIIYDIYFIYISEIYFSYFMLLYSTFDKISTHGKQKRISIKHLVRIRFVTHKKTYQMQKNQQP